MEYIFLALFSAFFSLSAFIGMAVLNFRSDYTKNDGVGYEVLNRRGRYHKVMMLILIALSFIFSVVCFALC